MLAGKLRHRVAIQSESESVDEFGEPDEGWTTDETVWASIDSVSGDETLSGEGQVGIVTHMIRMRYTSNATSKKRLLYGSRVFGIITVLNHMERNQYLDLECKEESN